MGVTKIEWVGGVNKDGARTYGYSFNPWWGCVEVSAACLHCYAETLAGRFGTEWGKEARRKFFGENHWNEPLKWQKQAERGTTAEERHPRVFCASMADVFEQLPDGHPDREAMETARQCLWALIEATPNLIWLLLTKRPENIQRMVPDWWWNEGFPKNVWVGVSAEDQKRAEERLPLLLKVPCRVRFVSYEPAVGPVDFFHYDEEECAWRGPGIIRSGGMTASTPDDPGEGYDDSHPGIDWIIAGGESGPGARPSHPDWFRSVRDQCQAAGVAFLFKQWGEHAPSRSLPEGVFNGDYMNDDDTMYRVGKKSAGRVLDGQTWDEVPQVAL